MSWSLGVETNARPLRAGSGRFWRAAALDDLGESGWSALAALGISTVVDLRNDSEVGTAPFRPSSMTVAHSPLEDPNDPEYTSLWAGSWAHPDFYAWGIRHWPDRWDAAFRAVADAPGGVVIHCAGGRDRTGVMVAVLLELAGLPRDEVLADYELGVRGSNAMLAARGDAAHPALIPNEVLERALTEFRPALDRLLTGLRVGLAEAGLAGVAQRAARRLENDSVTSSGRSTAR